MKRDTVRGRSQIFDDRYEWMNSIYKRVSNWKNHKRNVIIVRWEKYKEIPDDIFTLLDPDALKIYQLVRFYSPVR